MKTIPTTKEIFKMFDRSFRQLERLEKNEEFRLKKIWETWEGKRAVGVYGDKYIQTKDNEWQIRLKIWKANFETDCPAPMPFGHIMFK